MISIGEAFAWRLTPSGRRLFVRPLEIAAHTNMTIITNKRTYHFDIRSDEFTGKADEDLVYTVRFFYPQVGQPLPIPPQLAVPNVAAKKPQPPRPRPTPYAPPPSATLTPATVVKTPTPRLDARKSLPGIIERNPEGADINFEYSLAGKSDNIMPKKIYDNGSETNFQFANDNLVIPTISVVDSFGREQAVSYIIRDDFVVVPTIARQFTLRLSGGLLCVFNNRMMH